MTRQANQNCQTELSILQQAERSENAITMQEKAERHITTPIKTITFVRAESTGRLVNRIKIQGDRKLNNLMCSSRIGTSQPFTNEASASQAQARAARLSLIRDTFPTTGKNTIYSEISDQ